MLGWRKVAVDQTDREKKLMAESFFRNLFTSEISRRSSTGEPECDAVACDVSTR